MSNAAKIALASLGVWLAACSSLFEEPVQCAMDDDCARFADAVCGASGTCESRNGGSPTPITAGTLPNGAVNPAAVDPDAGAVPVAPPVDETCVPEATRPDAPFPGILKADGGAGTDITLDETLGCKVSYVLQGAVVVEQGATLRIKPGAVIKAEAGAALYIRPGAKIVAEGTPSQPIVFTSAAATKAPGDWQGLFLLGSAPPTGTLGNTGLTYGGDAEDDSSGSLKFVRVEYAARGLELDAVGRSTVVDGVQVRKTTDNCFTINGGRVDLRHLACQYPADEMFEFNAGYIGRAQFLIGQRTPTTGAAHHGILTDNATLTAANVTMCGADGDNQGIGVVLRNNSKPQLSGFIVRGFAVGLDVVGARGTPFELTNSVFQDNRSDNVAVDETSADTASAQFNDDQAFDERAFFADGVRKNSETDPGLEQCYAPAGPSFVPGTLPTADPPPSDAFFDATATYAGAVKDAANDWTRASWLVWSAD